MLQEIFVEFPRRILHAPEEKRSFEEASFEIDGQTVNLRPANQPLIPGHVKVWINTGGRGTTDISRLGVDVGAAVFAAIEWIAGRVGNNNWLIGSFGWLAKRREFIEFEILPDPWHVPDEYAEETEEKRTYDPLTDVIMDGIKGVRKFAVRYGDAHMTGALIAGDEIKDFLKFKRLIGAMRTEYGKKREVLYPQRHALLDMGKMPSIGYHILAFNYNEPQMVVIPRLFVPKGPWTVLDLFYNAEIRRDLEGTAADEYWEAHREKARETIAAILK